MNPNIAKMVKSPLPPLLVIGIAGAITAGVALADHAADRSSRHDDGRQIYMAEALEVASSESLEDWAGLADVVAAVSITSEERLDPAKSETSGQTGPIGRDVTVEVDKVLWTNTREAGRDMPNAFTMSAFGWMTSADGESREMATEGASRFEVGHDYLVALRWKPPTCADGDDSPGRWTAIGSGAALPADDGVIGRGEFEGSDHDAAGPALAQRYVGQPVTALTDDLADVKVARRDFPVGSPCA